MHQLSASFVLGYHGCDSDTAEELLKGAGFKASQNDYDWLGSGTYFWESNPLRALEFAREQGKRQGKSEPALVGAVIDLGFCLDLTTSLGIGQVRIAHDVLVGIAERAGDELPKNSHGGDLLLRRLDCAVVNTIHTIRDQSGDPVFDTVKGVFVEGEPAYENAGFKAKTHIQICVRNQDCIKGVFRVPDSQLKT